MIKKQINIILEVEDEPDYTYTPEAVLRAKSELLAEFLGCEVHDAERLLLDRVTDIGV
jgi:hypothetical protein